VSLAISLIYVSYSGLGTLDLSCNFSFLILVVYNIIIALLKFLLEKLDID
jgi:hypothetical protein